MNAQDVGPEAARGHLEKARDFIAKGESFYRKAAAEIEAAKQAEPTLSNREIGEVLGHGESWVRDLVRAATSSRPGANIDKPFARSPEGKERERRTEARRALRESPTEEIVEILSDPEVLENVVEAYQTVNPNGSKPRLAAARQRMKNRRTAETPHEKKQREAESAALKLGIDRAFSPMAAMSIVWGMESLVEDMQKFAGLSATTPEFVKELDRVFALLETEMEVLRAQVSIPDGVDFQ